MLVVSQGKNFAKSQELLAEAGAKEQSAATKEAAASKVKAAAQETLAALEKSLAANPKGKDMQIPLYDELGRPMNLAAEEARAFPSVPDAEDEETVVISFFDPEQAREFDETVKDELAGYPSPYLTRAVIMDKSLDELAERIKKGAGVNVKDPMFGFLSLKPSSRGAVWI